MRILWITPGFAAGVHDVNCIPPLQLLARGLLRAGVDLQVIALEYPFVSEPYRFTPLPVRAGDEAHPLQLYPCNGRNRRWLRWRTLARARAWARAILADYKFDAVHSFWLGPAWALGAQLANRCQTPHWTTLMGQDVLPQNRYTRRIDARAAAGLIALTPFHQSVLEQTTGLSAGHCIPWGLDLEEARIEPAVPRTLDVLGVGSLLPVKDWERWLRVLRQVADRRPALRAELIGAGPELGRLRALATALHLDGHIALTGELPRPAVLARMRRSRVLLHTARFESFGMVLAEAAANGCRVVSTPVGAAPQLGSCADTDETLAAGVVNALEAPLPAPETPVFRLEDTVSAYLQLYRVNENRFPEK